MVEVTKSTSDGITSKIYTGPLSGYDNGRWNNVDFSNNEPLLIYDWQTQNSYCVIPVQNTASTMNLDGNIMPVSSDLSIAS